MERSYSCQISKAGKAGSRKQKDSFWNTTKSIFVLLEIKKSKKWYKRADELKSDFQRSFLW
jgi:hypothetical protein